VEYLNAILTKILLQPLEKGSESWGGLNSLAGGDSKIPVILDLEAPLPKCGNIIMPELIYEESKKVDQIQGAYNLVCCKKNIFQKPFYFAQHS